MSGYKDTIEDARRKATDAAAKARHADARAEATYVHYMSALRKRGPAAVRDYVLPVLRRPRMLVHMIGYGVSATGRRVKGRFSAWAENNAYTARTPDAKDHTTRKHFTVLPTRPDFEKVTVSAPTARWFSQKSLAVRQVCRRPLNWGRRVKARVKDTTTQWRTSMAGCLTAEQPADSKLYWGKQAAGSSAGPEAPQASGIRGMLMVLKEGPGGKAVDSVGRAGRHLRELMLDPSFKYRQGIYHLRRYHYSPNMKSGIVAIWAIVFASGLVFVSTSIKTSQDIERQKLHEFEKMVDEYRNVGLGEGLIDVEDEHLLGRNAHHEWNGTMNLPGQMRRTGRARTKAEEEDKLIEFYMGPKGNDMMGCHPI